PVFQRLLQGIGLPEGNFIERGLAADGFVVMSHFFQTFGRDGNAFRDARKERADLFGSSRTAESDQKHRIVAQTHCRCLPRTQLMDCFDHGDDILDGSFGQNSMAQVEYMTGPAAGTCETFSDSSTDFLRRSKERGWIYIYLDPH